MEQNPKITKPIRDFGWLAVTVLLWSHNFMVYPAVLVNLLPLVAIHLRRWPIHPASMLPLALVPYLATTKNHSVTFLLATATFTALGYHAVQHIRRAMQNPPQRPPSHPLLWSAGIGTAWALATAAATIANHQQFKTGEWDLGAIANLFANIIAGLGQRSPAAVCNPDISHLDVHKSFIYYLIAPLFKIHPSAETLLVINAFSVPVGAVALHALARTILAEKTALAVAIAWVFYIPIQGGIFFDFHESSLMPPLLFASGWAILNKHKILPWLFVAALCTVKEETAMLSIPSIILFGIWAKRPKTTSAMAASMAVYSILINIPGPNTLNFGTIFANTGANNLTDLVKLAALHPSQIIELGIWKEKNLVGLLGLIVPLACIPIRTLTGILVMLPALALHYIPANESFANNCMQYGVAIAGPVFVALLHGIKTLNKEPHEVFQTNDVSQRNVIPAVLYALAVIFQITYGTLNPNNYARTTTVPNSAGEIEKTAAAVKLAEIRTISQQIPRDTIIMATASAHPHLAATHTTTLPLEVCFWESSHYFQGNNQSRNIHTLPEHHLPELIITLKNDPVQKQIPPEWSKQTCTFRYFEIFRRLE